MECLHMSSYTGVRPFKNGLIFFGTPCFALSAFKSAALQNYNWNLIFVVISAIITVITISVCFETVYGPAD